MNKVCRDHPVLQGRWENRRDHRRRRFNEETRAIQEFQAPQVTRATQDLLVPQVDRRVTKESLESRANEANQEKTVIQVLQDSLVIKEIQVHQVLLAGMEREDLKANADSRVLQEW